LNIDQFFEKKLKVSDVNRKIKQSHLINKNRLLILQKREQATNQVFEEAKDQLKSLVQGDYKTLMFALVLQGLYSLMEPLVVLRVLERDAALVEELIPSLIERFIKETKKPVKIAIDKTQPLSSTM
jgi:vacuolar-type H+-ATPase subunit E/Vma4